MPNDAKLGLVVGVGLVIAVAIIFFQRSTPGHAPAAIEASPDSQPDNVEPAAPADSSQRGAVEARTLIHQKSPDQASSAPPIHSILQPGGSQDPWKPVK